MFSFCLRQGIRFGSSPVMICARYLVKYSVCGNSSEALRSVVFGLM